MYGSGWCETCFCFRDPRRAIVAIGIFSMFCSTIQVLYTIAEFTGAKEVPMTPASKEVITYQLYIVLSCLDFVLFVCSLFMICGNEHPDQTLARNYFLPWLIFVPLYIIYETGVNIHYFYYQFNGKYEKPLGSGSALGYVIIPFVYWIVKDIIQFINFMFVIIRVQHLLPQVDYMSHSEPCQVYAPAPAPPRMALPQPPTIPRPVPARCASCSGGNCDGDRCRSCNLPQPMYGYAGFDSRAGFSAGNNPANWRSNIYNTGCH